MATSFFGGFQRGFERGVPLGVSEARQARAEQRDERLSELQARTAERQNTIQSISAFNTVMGLPSGPVRDFALRQVGEAFGLSKDFIQTIRKADQQQSQEIRSMMAGLGLSGMPGSAMQRLINDPVAFTEFLSQRETQQRLSSILNPGQQRVLSEPRRTPTQTPAATPPQELGPPMMPGGAVTPFELREPIVQGERGTLPPIQTPVQAPGGQAPGPTALAVAQQPPAAPVQSGLERRRDMLQQRLDALERLDITQPGVDTAIDNTRAALNDTRAAIRQQGDVKRQTSRALRGEFNRLTADFRTLTDSIGRIESIMKRPSPAGDIALVFSFMKINDPTSTVREGEAATVRNAAGVPARLRTMYNRLLAGDSLDQTVREDVANQARGLYAESLQRHNQLRNQYQALARRQGIDPQDVVLEFRRPTGNPRQESTGPARTSTGLSPGARRDINNLLNQ